MADHRGGGTFFAGVDMVLPPGGRSFETRRDAYRLYPEGVSFPDFHFCGCIAMVVGDSCGAGLRVDVLLVVFYAVFRGPGNLLYEALAREKDEPRRSWFVILPWLTTLIGGVVSNVLFGPLAIAGYLVTGMGDAIGEPVGTRFGRHPYRVWSLSSVRAERTVEGSGAVFAVSLLALVLTVLLIPALKESFLWFPRVVGIALIAAVVEAITPHGWDNATMQLVPTALVYGWMT